MPLTVNVPYGYVKDPENPKRWLIDPEAAQVVRRIFQMCMEGRGPSQIANQLRADKVLTPHRLQESTGTQYTESHPEKPLWLGRQLGCQNPGAPGVHGQLQDLLQFYLGQKAEGESGREAGDLPRHS